MMLCMAHSRHLLAHQSCRLQFWHLHIWQIACTHWQHSNQHANVRAVKQQVSAVGIGMHGEPLRSCRTVDRWLNRKWCKALTH